LAPQWKCTLSSGRASARRSVRTRSLSNCGCARSRSERRCPFPLVYKGHRLTASYRADFVCFDSVIVEIKVLKVRSGPLEEAQMLNYLRAAGMSTALLLNFGLPSLEYRRFVMSPDKFWRPAGAGSRSKGQS
jgi:GxxExxY protein